MYVPVFLEFKRVADQMQDHDPRLVSRTLQVQGSKEEMEVSTGTETIALDGSSSSKKEIDEAKGTR